MAPTGVGFFGAGGAVTTTSASDGDQKCASCWSLPRQTRQRNPHSPTFHTVCKKNAKRGNTCHTPRTHFLTFATFREGGGRKAAAGSTPGVPQTQGCDPKKMLPSGADAIAAGSRMRGHGVSGEPRVDWRELMASKASAIFVI